MTTGKGGSNRTNPQPEDRRGAQRKEDLKIAEGRLSEPEMIAILEDIARNAGNAAARITAIKALREIGAGENPPVAGFEALDELAPRRRAA